MQTGQTDMVHHTGGKYRRYSNLEEIAKSMKKKMTKSEQVVWSFFILTDTTMPAIL